MTTAYMNLTLPAPSVTAGPTWASELNVALTTIDLHDHSAGFGRPVRSAGLSIDADLPCGGFNLTSLRSLRLANQAAALSLGTDIGCIYEAGGNLYYNNSIGQQIQITAGAGLNASSIGGIGGDYVGSGASVFYTSASQTFTFWQAASTPANLSIGSLTASADVSLTSSGEQSVSKTGGGLHLGTDDSNALFLKTLGVNRLTIQGDGNINANGHVIFGLANPLSADQAATKGYVDTGLALKAPLASPTFTGTVTVPTLDVSGTATVPTPSSSSHAATKGYVDGLSDGAGSISWASGWGVNGGGGATYLQLLKANNGLVYFRAEAVRSSGSSLTMLTLPSGYRPSGSVFVSLTDYNGTTYANLPAAIRSTGVVELVNNPTITAGHNLLITACFVAP